MGVVKERMDSMLVMADALERLTDLIELADPDAAELRDAAAVIERNAGSALTSMFPEGSLDPPSQADPTIWNEWPEFAAISNELERLAGSLGEAVGAHKEASGSPLIEPVRPAVARRRVTWNDLDERELLGLRPDRRIADLIESNSLPSPEDVPDLAELYRGVVENCAACHARFRRERP